MSLRFIEQNQMCHGHLTFKEFLHVGEVIRVGVICPFKLT